MENNESRGGLLAAVALYVAWFVAAAGSVVDAIAFREALLSILAVFRVVSTEAYHRRGGVGEDIFTGFGISALDNVMLLILGCAAIAITIWVEYYFRKGRPQGLLYKRIIKVIGTEIGIIVLAIIIIEIAGFALSQMG
ncbi:MAG: hypothetical protein IH586_10480 [Anaerolineaceae bacterium]|nr:hypothetical protein [Anaerolineaceae bacterium]